MLEVNAWLENAHDFGIDADTWLGLEEQEASAPSNQGVTLTGVAAAVNMSNLPVQELGLFNVGTNLLTKLLTMNFASYWEPDAIGLPVWKHTKPTDIIKFFKDKPGALSALKDVAVVAMIRDPMSWVQSLRKAPYDLQACVLGDWATGGCNFPAPGELYSTFKPEYGWASHTHAFHVDNIESVWNEWNSQYERLGELGFGAHTLISYEELVLDTEGALSKIAKVMRVPPPTYVHQLRSPAKEHGRPNGRAEAIKKLRTKSYLALYTEQTRREVCARLNRSLMHAHGYYDCDGW